MLDKNSPTVKALRFSTQCARDALAASSVIARKAPKKWETLAVQLRSLNATRVTAYNAFLKYGTPYDRDVLTHAEAAWSSFVKEHT